MARGTDESHNPNRRPQRPLTSLIDEDEEVIQQMIEDERQKRYNNEMYGEEIEPYEEKHIPEDRGLDAMYEDQYANLDDYYRPTEEEY